MQNDSFEVLVHSPIREWYDTVVDIPIRVIKPDPDNLRTEFDEDDLFDLGKNIEEVGQLDAITVFPLLADDGEWSGFFDLHDGERRWRAAQLVGLSALTSKIVPRPSQQELMYKKVSRVMQTRSLSPETKLLGLERALNDLGVADKPEQWQSLRGKLGGGPEWPQLIRVLQLHPNVRSMLGRSLINFTIAQSVGRLPVDKQEQLTQYAVVNKISGRFLSTQMVPYLIQNPDASPAQAFEHARVGGWKRPSNIFRKGEAPLTDAQVEKFLDACVHWERAWETLVLQGLVHEVEDRPQDIYRLKEASRRLTERASALLERLSRDDSESSITPALPAHRENEDSV
ncbi:MAG: ParB/RepB/Spo0J family partition protein [Chloroflexi bacterium]|nr:ParB/RepB/Spo0J family partition protein [Chloroflexota bacterium]